MKQIPFNLAIMSPRQEVNGKAIDSISNDEMLEQARCRIINLVEAGKYNAAFENLQNIIAIIENDKFIFDMVTVASWYQIGAWIYVHETAYTPAIDFVVKALQHLAGAEEKTPEIKAMAAALLCDYAIACHALNSRSKAKHALRKSAELYRSLYRSSHDIKYLSACTYVVSAVPEIIDNRIERLYVIDMLAAAIEKIEGKLPGEMVEGISDLVYCIAKEAGAMQAVGRYRTAVRNYTKAIRLSMRISDAFDERSLHLSVKLAEVLLFVPTRKVAAHRLLASLKKFAEAKGIKAEIAEINRIEEREQLIQFNLLTYLRNFYS